LTVSTAILIPALRLLNPQKLDRLPIWLRWVLVMPTAFIVGTVAELVPRFLFSLIEITINHELTFRPGFDSLTWQAYAPLFFVIGGILMAPSYRFGTFIALGGLKITVAALNLYNVLDFTKDGLGWSRRDPITKSPLWWNVPVYILCICLLVGLGVFMALRKPQGRGKLPETAKNGSGLNYVIGVVSSMGLNVLWFIALCVWSVYTFLVPNVVTAYHYFGVFFRRFTWFVVFSPCLEMFLAAVLFSILAPVVLLAMIPGFFESTSEAYSRRYLWSVGVGLLIPVSAVLLQFIILGTFPFPADPDGSVRLRMIPFLPWPAMDQ
jgi:hypothetical protein